MSAYDFQKATADRIAEIFRSATIDENGQEIKQGGQRRVLLADEVGLGKTHVASEVIARVREMRKEVNDDMFRVVYVCSNMSIANQNIQKLGIKNKADVSESRLSMQHLTIREREAEITNPNSEEMGEIIIPLTPSTSFSLTGKSMGNANERALIAQILVRLDALKPYQQKIYSLFRGWSGDEGWSYSLKRYDWRINRLVEKSGTYIQDITKYLNGNNDFIKIKKELIEYFEGVTPEIATRGIVNRLRHIFADLSLSMLEPDLIIMDEFQRFSSLLDYSDDNEQTAIVRKFFDQSGGQQPLILLLSATPYKPYTTLEELTEYNADTHYQDFNRLMDFLFAGGNNFKEVWSDYSHRLSHISSVDFDVLIASKRIAEDTMYQAMCRTERLNQGLLKDCRVELPIDENDILAFCEMQRIVDGCKEAALRSSRSRFHWSNMPVEYVKSAPYLLSFMESYELKKQIDSIYRGGFKELPVPSEITLLRKNDIENFHKQLMRNARMQYLRDAMLPKGKGAELLLWVPASKPYYTTNAENPFVKNSDFSKLLIFSAWEMVPRAISVMMSYEHEREVIFSKYKKAKYSATTGRGRLKKDAQQILVEPSRYLASLYNQADWYGRPVHIIKAHIRKQITERLSGIQTTERHNYSKILAILRWLDNPGLSIPEEIPSSTVDILTDIAIAGPGVCLLRIFNNDTTAKSAATGFVKIFNRRVAGYIIDKMQDKYHNDEVYLEGVLDYCVLGNLQAVLDEYAHMSGRDFADNMTDAFIDDANLYVDTDESFGNNSKEKTAMRISYAVPFSKSKPTSSDESQKRANNIRCAFQSPFFPFVVASTSVGQEGLDFHWYCRKIMHWNLPSNPQDLEQREGRINRYKCLAIRRNLAHQAPDIFDWNTIFKNANELVRKMYGNIYSQMVPNWCLPTEWIKENNSTLEWIERIVPQYPMSIDNERYQRLIEVLSLYRLTMGQPRQEELLELLENKNLSEQQISQLLFDLSPINRR